MAAQSATVLRRHERSIPSESSRLRRSYRPAIWPNISRIRAADLSSVMGWSNSFVVARRIIQPIGHNAGELRDLPFVFSDDPGEVAERPEVVYLEL